MSDIEKLPLTSMNIVDDQIQKFKKLFPETLTEGNRIDWDKLRLTLGETIDTGKERYGMNWPGKADCFKTIQQPSIATLIPARDESIDFDTTENLFIEGDNLEVLKLLQKSYLGKVKVICVDPPYNTGNEFIYPDNYTENLQTYLEYTGQVDSEGRKFGTNTDTDGRFHSKWMNMMYPRLFLAKNLLMEEGVIFIFIGDDEYDNLKKVCNELFGEENFISTISRMMKSGGAKGNFFTPNIDFILVYAKNINATKYFRSSISDEQLSGYYNKIESEGEKKDEYFGEERLYKASLDPRPNQRYWIECPDGSFAIPPGVNFPQKLINGEKVFPTSEDGVWKWIFDRYSDEFNKGNIVFKSTTTTALVDQNGVKSKWNIYNKVWLAEQQEKGMVPSNFILKYENRQSAAELKELEIPFDFAKPSKLIQYLLSISKTENNDLILDFFAGSATTAHAVYELNKEDGYSRKYICVQLPEPTDEKSEAYKAGYKNISEVSKERIRRVINKINKEVDSLDKQRESLILKMAELSNQIKQEEDKVPANMFGDEKTNKAIEKLKFEFQGLELKAQEILQKYIRANEMDKGFKVYKLQPSNFKIWDANISKNPEVIQKSLFEHIAHINPESAQEAILYELLLKSGFELTTNIENLTIDGKTVFSISKGELLICLEHDLTNNLIKAMAELQPIRVICLDEGFHNNDQLKTNAVLIMKSKGVVNFRTI